MEPELREWRRHIHKDPEVGLYTPRTREYVMDRLRDMGIEVRQCGEGAEATVGSGGRLMLLRADMDALPVEEQSGLPFASENGCAHACGHDMHTAMLLGAAKLLRQREGELGGRVRFMFQSGEEIMEGAADMMAHGILEPLPDAALALHVGGGHTPVGTVLYSDEGTMMFSVDSFDLLFMGEGCHGAYPHMGKDPLNMAVHAYMGLQSLVSRERDPALGCALTVGKLEGGASPNTIPHTARLQGTLRTDSPALRAGLLRRIEKLAHGVAGTYGGSVQVTLKEGAPPLSCHGELTRELIGYIRELPIPNLSLRGGIRSSASEDFARLLQRVPGSFIYLGAGFEDERGDAPAHSPAARFNEAVLPIGAACMAHCALRYLQR